MTITSAIAGTNKLSRWPEGSRCLNGKRSWLRPGQPHEKPVLPLSRLRYCSRRCEVPLLTRLTRSTLIVGPYSVKTKRLAWG